MGIVLLGITSKTTFNNDQPRSGKEKDLWLETLFRDYSWDIETHCYEKPSKSAQIAIAQVVKYLTLETYQAMLWFS